MTVNRLFGGVKSGWVELEDGTRIDFKCNARVCAHSAYLEDSPEDVDDDTAWAESARLARVALIRSQPDHPAATADLGEFMELIADGGWVTRDGDQAAAGDTGRLDPPTPSGG